MVNVNAYVEDVQRYLAKKLPDVDATTIFEITEYIGYRTGRLMMETVDNRDAEWKRSLGERSHHD